MFSEESSIRVVLGPDCPGLFNDPRITKLFALDEELGCSGKHVGAHTRDSPSIQRSEKQADYTEGSRIYWCSYIRYEVVL